MIKRIELVNFMSHAHTVIEPAAGLTVLVGPNNCGKSAILTALQILCHNENSTYVIRHGEKECSVTVETDDGDIIQWSRNKNSSKYVINGVVYDRLRGSVPPILNEKLKLPKVKLEQSPETFDIHFGSQKEPVFLINESGRAAAGFFAASSDASRLIEMQKLHGQKIKDAGRDIKRLDKEAADLQDVVDQLQSIPDLTRRFSACDELLKSVDIHDVAVRKLVESIAQIRRSQTLTEQLSLRQKIASAIPEPPSLHNTTPLAELTESIKATDSEKARLNILNSQLSKLRMPPGLNNTGPLSALVAQSNEKLATVRKAVAKSTQLDKLRNPPKVHDCNSLRNLVTDISSILSVVQQHKTRLQQLQSLEQELNRQVEDFIERNPTCPTCQQPLSKRHFNQHANGGNDG